MDRPYQPLSRTIGLKPLRISPVIQWLVVVFLLAMPLGLLAVFMFPSGEPGFRSVFSPGSMVATFVAKLGYPRPAVGPTAALTDFANGLGTFLEIAWTVNVAYYGALLFFCVVFMLKRAKSSGKFV